MRIKPGIAWFPVPMQWRTAMADLSDGAFKLFVYLCLNANRETGQLTFSQTRLAQALGKSRRSLAGYLQELQQRQFCIVHRSANQYAGGTIQIQQAYWAYEPNSPTALDDYEAYLESIKSYVQPRACVRCRFSKLDLELGQEWFRKGLKLDTIEHAIILACSRKYVSWLNGGNLNPIGSLRYFEQTLEEVIRDKTPPEYWDFLKMQLKRIEHQWLSSQRPACEHFAQAKKETR